MIDAIQTAIVAPRQEALDLAMIEAVLAGTGVASRAWQADPRLPRKAPAVLPRVEAEQAPAGLSTLCAHPWERARAGAIARLVHLRQIRLGAMAACGFNHFWARGLSHFRFQTRRPRRREENHTGRHHQSVDATTRQGHTAGRQSKLQKQSTGGHDTGW